MTYRLVITKPGSLLPVIIDRELTNGQTERVISLLSDEQSIDGYLEQVRRDVKMFYGSVPTRPDPGRRT